MINISVRTDVQRLSASLDDLACRQVPYAAAVAVNDLAFQALRAERDAIPTVFRNPRPFTRRGVVVTKATKGNPVATVSMRPEIATYLAPYEFGGKHELPSKALLNPKGIRLDQYGQISRTATRTLSASPKVFAGQVRGVHGFWRRLRDHRLKLLLRFGDALVVRKHLGFRLRAVALVRAEFPAAFNRAMARALATMRR